MSGIRPSANDRKWRMALVLERAGALQTSWILEKGGKRTAFFLPLTYAN